MMLREKIRQLLHWHFITPSTDIVYEGIYQRIFDNQCRLFGIPNDFYPLGGAASHGMLMMIARLLTEDAITEIVEFGSGQSTILVDRLRSPNGFHLCLESDSAWHARVSKRLKRCEYVLAPLQRQTVQSVDTLTYPIPQLRDFDLLIVDGPQGTARYSRFGCTDWIASNKKLSFVIVVDDSSRSGERDTVGWIREHLRDSKLPFQQRELRGRTIQTFFAVGAFQHVTLYF